MLFSSISLELVIAATTNIMITIFIFLNNPNPQNGEANQGGSKIKRHNRLTQRSYERKMYKLL